MNRQIRQLALGLMACYVVLFAALNYWQVGRKPELDARFDNTRQVLREFNKPRGPIVTSDGIVAAVSSPTPPGERYDYRRDYPTDDLLADITGYFTFAFGSTQVERMYGDVLTGSTTEQQIRGLADLLTGGTGSTGTVELAVRHDAQQVAKFLLGGQSGSITVIEPRTGAIRAMYSNPTFDPNTFVNADFAVAQQTITDLQNAPGNPLLAQAYQERYMPGSTFKVITTGIALENGAAALDSVFAEEREWVPPQTDDPIQNYNRSLCGGDLATVFARSCNIPFAQLAVLLGPEAMVAGAEAWGMGEPLPIDLPRPAASTFGSTDNLSQELPLLAIRGFGQSEVQMVPLHMAMVAATVANGGQMMVPYAVESTFDEEGRVLDETRPQRVEDPDLTADRRDRTPADDRGRRAGYGELLYRVERRHSRGGKDRHRRARCRVESRPVSRLDRRLRAGRQPAVRGVGGAHERAVDRRRRGDRRPPRRSAGQGHARLPAHRPRLSGCRMNVVRMVTHPTRHRGLQVTHGEQSVTLPSAAYRRGGEESTQ
jgi:penicillin-binding protein A